MRELCAEVKIYIIFQDFGNSVVELEIAINLLTEIFRLIRRKINLHVYPHLLILMEGVPTETLGSVFSTVE